MAALSHAVVSLAFARSVLGAYPCPTGTKAAESDPSCAGGNFGTCLSSTCCYTIQTCGELKATKESVCNTGTTVDDLKMWDDVKTATEVSGYASDDDIKASCCILASAAKCSNWAGKTCSTGFQIAVASRPTTSAPAFPVNGTDISEDKFLEACCTQEFADATCNDWILILGAPNTTCDEGKTVDNTLSAPGQGNASNTLTDEEFETTCCKAKAKAECESHACPAETHDSKVATTQCPTWETGSCTNDICCTVKPTAPTTCGSAVGSVTCGDDEFDDDKKAATIFDNTGDQTAQDAKRKAACCTARADSMCSDWTSSMSCAENKFDSGPGVAAPPTEGENTITQDKYRELCCVDALTCANAAAPTPPPTPTEAPTPTPTEAPVPSPTEAPTPAPVPTPTDENATTTKSPDVPAGQANSALRSTTLSVSIWAGFFYLWM